MKKQTYQEESAFQRFCKNMKSLTFEQKIDHILRYYWGTIILVILIPVAFGIILSSMLKEKPELVFSGNCCNVTLNAEGQSYVINDWNTRLNMEPGKLLLNLDFTETAGLSGLDVDEGLQVVAAVAANNLDYILCDSVAMEYLGVQQAFLPVDQVFSEETLSTWSDRIYYYTDEEDGTTYAVGLDVSQMPFFHDCVPENAPVYFIFANKENADTQLLQLFWSHLEAWEGE